MTSFKTYRNIPVDYSVIKEHFPDLDYPKDKIARLTKNGSLVRLKKGKYLITENLRKDSPSLELIANHLYGPSYVSFETALNFYGWIPERAYLIKSAVKKRRKQFKTPLGIFEYLTIPENYFEIGIRQHILNSQFAFLIASPEKALCDLIVSTRGLRIQSFKAMKEYLFLDLRIESDNLRNCDISILDEAIKLGHKKTELSFLRQVAVSLVN